MRQFAVAVALAIALTACPAPDPHVDLGMSDSAFVKTMVRLHRVAVDSTIDQAARDSARHLVLNQQKVTAAQLEAAARALALEPVRAESLWTRIDRQAKPRNAATP